MKKLNTLTQTIWCLFLCVTPLLLHNHTHFSICKRVPELEAMLQAGAGAGAEEDIKESDEMQMDSEMNRRLLLMSKSYLSYETLRRDMTPCGRPGASYYNCRSTGVANPYTRGCEMIVGCARDIRDINF